MGVPKVTSLIEIRCRWWSSCRTSTYNVAQIPMTLGFDLLFSPNILSLKLICSFIVGWVNAIPRSIRLSPMKHSFLNSIIFIWTWMVSFMAVLTLATWISPRFCQSEIWWWGLCIVSCGHESKKGLAWLLFSLALPFLSRWLLFVRAHIRLFHGSLPLTTPPSPILF